MAVFQSRGEGMHWQHGAGLADIWSEFRFEGSFGSVHASKLACRSYSENPS